MGWKMIVRPEIIKEQDALKQIEPEPHHFCEKDGGILRHQYNESRKIIVKVFGLIPFPKTIYDDGWFKCSICGSRYLIKNYAAKVGEGE